MEGKHRVITRASRKSAGPSRHFPLAGPGAQTSLATQTGDQRLSEEKLTFSVEEAAKWLGVGRSAAYELVRTGALFSIRVGRRVLIPRRALEKLLGEEAPPVAATTPSEAPRVLWKPCSSCKGTGVIGVKPRSEGR